MPGPSPPSLSCSTDDGLQQKGHASEKSNRRINSTTTTQRGVYLVLMSEHKLSQSMIANFQTQEFTLHGGLHRKKFS